MNSMTTDKPGSKVRVRFAPSPTGRLHIGGARTTLFVWLFARQNQGTFILRIEDTDKERSKKEFEEDIIASLKWLGLDWDEFYRQSDRVEIYKKGLEKLLAGRKAYYCFCSKEDLEAEKKNLEASGLPPKYSGRCRTIPPGDADKRAAAGERHVIRLLAPEKKIEFTDIIRGAVTFDSALFGDFVIAKGVNEPLYNFAVVIDDSSMAITHVIRAEEHFSNTPRQILIYEALGFTPPQFAHVPLILNPDRSKMSKRYNDVALTDYRAEGYLPDAIFNFLAYLGWHPKDDKEVMSRGEIIQEFDLSRVQKAGAVFNIDKLNWLNQQYISRLGDSEFITMAAPYLPAGWRLTPAMIASVKNRVRKMSEIKDLVSVYFELPDYAPELLRWKDMPLSAVAENLKSIQEILNPLSDGDFTIERLQELLTERTKDKPKGEVFWPLRVALSGMDKSPTPFEIMAALGKNESLRRIQTALNKCQSNG